jgi:hypothetical protein
MPLGGFAQPVQHGVGVDLEDPGCGTDTQPFSQTRSDSDDQLDRGLFAVEERAVGL